MKKLKEEEMEKKAQMNMQELKDFQIEWGTK